jgi:REP element-mobilizing transposase RayT
MPRRPRDTAAGIFHVYTHCVWAADAFFRDDFDRQALLRQLPRAIELGGWTCIAFCLMTTHHHLIIEVPDQGLQVGMHHLNFMYAVHFNRRHTMKGHVQGRRYGATRISDEDFLLNRYKYVVRNAAEAGLCDHPAAWHWSSYAGTVGLAEPFSFVNANCVLACFEGPREQAVVRLREFVENE